MSKRSWLGDLVDQLHPAEWGGRAPAPCVALPPPSLTWQVEQLTCRYDLTRASQRGLRVVGVDQPGPVVAPRGQRALEHADVLERAELVVDGAAVVAVAVELERGEAQDEARRSRVADQALGAGGEPPDLLAAAARLGRVGHLELLGGAGGGDQLGVGLLGVPAVGVADPFPLLAGQQAGLDPLAAGLPASSTRSRLSVCTRTEPLGRVQAPPALSWGFCSIRSRPGRAANRSIVAPSAHCGRVHLVRERGRVGPVVGDRGEQARLAQPGRERLRGPVGLGRRLEAIEPAHLVDDVQLAGVVGAEAGDVERGVDQLAVPGGLRAVVLDPPDAAGGPVAVDVGPDQLGQAGAAVDPAAGERAGLAVVVLGGRRRDRVGARPCGWPWKTWLPSLTLQP